MRVVTLSMLAALGLGGVNAARAADLDEDFLRGSDYDPPPAAAIDWSGVYLGGHGGFTSGGFSQASALQSQLADYFRDRDIENQFSVSHLVGLPGARARGPSFGAFAGYNVQFDDIVLGAEVDYTHTDQRTASTSVIGRIYTTTAGMSEVVNLSGRSVTRVEDYGSVRFRAGYSFGPLLPYVTAGVAVGQVAFTDSVAVQNYGYDTVAYNANIARTSGLPSAVSNHGYAVFNPNFPLPNALPTDGTARTVPAAAVALPAPTRGKTLAGAALGAGLEYALTPNVLLRGEYQFVRFQDFNGHSAQLNTVRGGAAVKF